VLPPGEPGARIGGGILAGFRLVARSRYLLGITAIIAIGSIAGAFMYYELLHLVEARYPDLGSRGQFLGRLELTVSVASWVFQAFVVGWLIRHFQLTGALVTVPLASLASFLALAAAPLLLVLAAGQVVRRGGEYGIAKPSREVLFTVVDAETKYKAKNFIDTVLQRGGDLVGIWLFSIVQACGCGNRRVLVHLRDPDGSGDRDLLDAGRRLRTTAKPALHEERPVQARERRCAWK
jgi:AAA family ATP:ADP antiporter